MIWQQRIEWLKLLKQKLRQNRLLLAARQNFAVFLSKEGKGKKGALMKEFVALEVEFTNEAKVRREH